MLYLFEGGRLVAVVGDDVCVGVRLATFVLDTLPIGVLRVTFMYFRMRNTCELVGVDL